MKRQTTSEHFVYRLLLIKTEYKGKYRLKMMGSQAGFKPVYAFIFRDVFVQRNL